MAAPTGEPKTWMEGPIEWCRQDLDTGVSEGLAGKVRLRCNHVLCTAARLEKSPDPGAHRASMKYLQDKLYRQLKEAFDNHDCATYERDLVVQRVTSRLAGARQ